MATQTSDMALATINCQISEFVDRVKYIIMASRGARVSHEAQLNGADSVLRTIDRITALYETAYEIVLKIAGDNRREYYYDHILMYQTQREKFESICGHLRLGLPE